MSKKIDYMISKGFVRNPYTLNGCMRRFYQDRIDSFVEALKPKSSEYLFGHLEACLDCLDLFDLEKCDMITLQIVVEACFIVLEQRGKL